MKTILNILKWILALGIILFSIATFFGKSYLQTIILLFIAILIVYWPHQLFSKKWNNKISTILRITLILILFAFNKIISSSNVKTSIYRSEKHQEELMNIYDKELAEWPVDYESIYINTEFGKMHLVACGPKDSMPIFMLHAAAMGAISWSENVEGLSKNYRIYAIDNIGEGSRSKLNDALNFPQTGKEIADLYIDLANQLSIDSMHIISASNGGYIGMNISYYYPEKVKSLTLLGPMGLTLLSNKSIMKMTWPSMYPIQPIIQNTVSWAIGNDENVLKNHGEWFNTYISSVIPSVAGPVPMTTEQKSKMDLPVLLFLGTKDPIVGDIEIAKNAAKDYPNIKIFELESGHLIGSEHANFVNEKILEFLLNH